MDGSIGCAPTTVRSIGFLHFLDVIFLYSISSLFAPRFGPERNAPLVRLNKQPAFGKL